MNTVHYSVHGAVAVLTLDHPPVNALSQRMRKAIRTYLELANADAAIGAVIIIGSQKAFSAGADIKEARTPQGIEENRIGMKVQDRVDKPIVAAIGGYALGGGMEFALCSHFRVASPGARLGLPEVKIGRVPSSGGTQRLPRLIGVAAAARMMLHGELVSSEQAKEIGLIDEIVEGDLLDGALRYADRLIAEHKGPRRIRNMSAKLDNTAAFFASQRAELERTRRGYCAPLWILECLEAAVALPFDEGKAIEEKNGDLARDSLQAKALQYAFMAERAAAKIPDVPAETVAREIRQVAVIGAGATGAGIATCFACSGIPVRLIDGEPEALVRGLAAIRDNYSGMVAQGRLAQTEMDRRLALISTAPDFAGAAEADIVVDTVFEQIPSVFKALDAIAKPGAILAVTTSMPEVDRIAAEVSRPHEVIGLRFLAPAHETRLLEVVRSDKTAKDVIATAGALGKRLAKVAVVSRAACIGERMLEKSLSQMIALLEEGASPRQIDDAMENWGYTTGPFAMSDLAGHDSGRFKRLMDKSGDIFPSALVARLRELGRYGQTAGRGWYRYECDSTQSLPDPEVEQLIAEHRRRIGAPRRKITDDEIVARWVFALANEAAYILEESGAQRASDIDTVFFLGYGFPRYRGGPMFYADTVGLETVLCSIEQFARGHRGELWIPAPSLRTRAAEHGTFV